MDKMQIYFFFFNFLLALISALLVFYSELYPLTMAVFCIVFILGRISDQILLMK